MAKGTVFRACFMLLSTCSYLLPLVPGNQELLIRPISLGQLLARPQSKKKGSTLCTMQYIMSPGKLRGQCNNGSSSNIGHSLIPYSISISESLLLQQARKSALRSFRTER